MGVPQSGQYFDPSGTNAEQSGQVGTMQEW
jgi:hypothetical protein